MVRKIMHLDLDAFFCAVEELQDPSLKGKPFAVGGLPESRGVVSSCSYAARQHGIRSAMPMGKALHLLPQLIIISSRHAHYSDYSDKVMQRIHQLTPLVEQISIDEAFLDVSDMPEDGAFLAKQLQTRILQEVGLPCSLGVASNKLVAKIASDVGKAGHRGVEPPSSITVVPPGEEARFLASLPTQALWGIGPKSAARLADLGIRTIGDLARLPERVLLDHFGKMGPELHRRALGIDDSPVNPSAGTAKSISNEHTYDKDTREEETILKSLRHLSEHVGGRLRHSNLAGTVVQVKLRWADFTTLTRQTSLPCPTDQDGVIYKTAAQLFQKVWREERYAVRLVGVGVSGLVPAQRQLSLWDVGLEKEHKLLKAIDELRERYGEKIIQRAEEMEQRD
ncbi:MAG: DNA polymerase IV [Anaerolineaceae bacterium]|nr:DNA polymerase IV [Anaerolineaceae bacterium]MBN2676761.1 DNA polymerase IV [Anaerolineaceae bacterium]